LAIDHLRRNRPEQSFQAEPAGAPQPDPLLQHETRERIQQAFYRLPAKLQVAATLALVEELPYDEIASALATSVGAVKLRVFRAVRILRKRLSHTGITPK
jgi:RNA polymerase sigma factor (sigma-70 family)